jgi:threonine synthase
VSTAGAGRATPRSAGSVAAYRSLLAIDPEVPVVTLGEGGTPLLHAKRLSARVGAEVWLKVEGANPTGSFKDRGMALAVSKARARGAGVLLCASTGNTSASAAAYAAAAGLRSAVVIPEGHVARGKLAQAVVHGARVVQVRANFDAALAVVRALGERAAVTVVNSVNPDRLEGQKTAAFEVVDELGDAPDLLCIPVGNAGNITAYWRGFCQYREAGRASLVPRLLGVQAVGAAPLVGGGPVPSPETVATAIRIGDPASAGPARDAVGASGGRFVAVTDSAILAAQRELASTEGVFCEPASAASVAGLLAYPPAAGSRVVCVLTGHGLKDPDAVAGEGPLPVVAADLGAVAEAMGVELD